MTHTPGPWEADRCKDSGSHYHQIYAELPDGMSGPPYTVSDTLNRHHCISPEEDAANAKLIAAAPDLLMALEAIVTAIRRIVDPCTLGSQPVDGHPLYESWKIASEALKGVA